MNDLVLASTSAYRFDLLKKLGIKFRAEKPKFDEETQKLILLQQKASPLQIAETLSKGKASSLKYLNATVIGGDQLVHTDGKILGKSGQFKKAFEQLQCLRGKTHELITAVTIQANNQQWHLNHITSLKMKNLSDSEIENYLKKDQPYDCAGSYKIESCGLILFDRIKTDDFSAIQGLPLLWISNRLKELGYEFFKYDFK